MIKFLIAVLLMITGLKLITNNGALLNKIMFQLSTEKAQGNNDIEESEKSKYENDDKIYMHYSHNYLVLNLSKKFSSQLANHKPYCSFIARPGTPPPDVTF